MMNLEVILSQLSLTNISLYLKISGILTLILIAIVIYNLIVYPYYLGPLANLPRPKNSIKHFINLLKQRIMGDVDHLLQLSLNYGPVVHLSDNMVLVNDPLIKKHLQSSKFKKSEFYRVFDFQGLPNLLSGIDKTYHSMIKKLVLPAFSVKSLTSVEKTVYDIGSQGLVNHIQSSIKAGLSDVFDLFHLFHCSAFDVNTQLIFSTNFKTIFDKDKANYYLNSLEATTNAMFLRTLIPLYDLLHLPIEKVFKPIILNFIKLRELNNYSMENKDILQILLDSKGFDKGDKLTNNQIVNECMILLFAGVDTTAHTLTWTLYELLKNPEIYKLVETEVLEKFPNLTECISIQKAKTNLKYLKAAILESLRMYPIAASGMPRVVPEGGITIASHYLPEKTVIIQSIYNLHYDPNLWKSPQSYNINRWLDTNFNQNKSNLTPFGYGSHSCIGKELALNQIYLILINLIRNFNLELVDKELGKKFKFLFRPEEAKMRVKISIRK